MSVVKLAREVGGPWPCLGRVLSVSWLTVRKWGSASQPLAEPSLLQ